MATKKKQPKKAEPEPKPVAVERPTINTRRGKIDAGRDFSGLDYPIHLEHGEWTVEAGDGKRIPRGVTANDSGELEGFLRAGYRVVS